MHIAGQAIGGPEHIFLRESKSALNFAWSLLLMAELPQPPQPHTSPSLMATQSDAPVQCWL